ncbi:hypothetical protein HZA57_05420 [Candidatus Poribacteria bacterium]|nr:hypothetical protein [Candidatus Poribacteria bacterium]
MKHQLVLSEELHIEWRNHASGFSKKWLAAMYGKNLVAMLDPLQRLERIRAWLSSPTCPLRSRRKVIEKDLHLVEAALQTDRRIASGERKVREHLCEVMRQYRALERITWVNPCRPEEESHKWLRGGAPDEPARHLKHWKPA